MIIQFEYGERTVVLKPPFLVRKRIRRKWLKDKFEYLVIWEYCKMNYGSSLDAAENCIAIAGMYLK